VIKVGMGFGSGGGEGTEAKSKKGQGMGAGAGVGIEPIGFLVTKGDEISFLEAGKAHGLAAAFEKVPDLIDKYVETIKKKDEELV
ncbi:MAG: GerW family sporulation protein, partial [Eudoraea sp.]